MTEAHACEQLAKGCYLEADRSRFEPARPLGSRANAVPLSHTGHPLYWWQILVYHIRKPIYMANDHKELGNLNTLTYDEKCMGRKGGKLLAYSVGSGRWVERANVTTAVLHCRANGHLSSGAMCNVRNNNNNNNNNNINVYGTDIARIHSVYLMNANSTPSGSPTLKLSQPKWSVSPPVVSNTLHPQSSFIIISESESWHLFYCPTESGKLCRPRHCRLYDSDIQWDSILGALACFQACYHWATDIKVK